MLPTNGVFFPMHIDHALEELLEYQESGAEKVMPFPDLDIPTSRDTLLLGAFMKNSEILPAYHGTPIYALASILRDGLKPGPSHTDDAVGIYCEGQHRAGNTFNYMTHDIVFPQRREPYMWGVLLECIVDRQFGRTVHKQWCQKPGSIVVTGALLHCININGVVQKGVEKVGFE